eukprot:UN21231
MEVCTNIDHKYHFATKHVNFLKQNELFFLAVSFLLQVCVTNIQYLKVVIPRTHTRHKKMLF